MARKISAAPASANDSYAFSENSGVNTTLNVRVNDGKSSSRPIHSLDNGQLADLDAGDPVSNAGSTTDRSALGAAIWINANGTVGYSTAPIAALVEALAPSQTLQDSFIYATVQANGSLLWSTVSITITGTNDAPIARVDNAVASEDSLTTGSVAANDTDVDNGAVLSSAATSSAAGFTMASNGSWTLDTSNASYQDLAAGETRQVIVDYSVTDQYNASSTSSLTLTVTGTNDAPVATAASVAVMEGGNASGRVLGVDADRGDSLQYSLVSKAPVGLSFSSDGNWTFDANQATLEGLGAGETRTFVVTYAASDTAGASGTATLTIVVTGTNDAPVALAASSALLEDGAATGQLIATDVDNGHSLTFSIDDAAPEGFSLTADGSWSFDGNLYEYQALSEGEEREFAIGYTVTDEHGAASQSTLTVSLTGANDRPVTTSHWAEVTEGETATGQLIGLDQDHGAQLSFAVEGDAPAGFSLAADGSWSFDASNGAYDHLTGGAWEIVQIPFALSDEHGATISSFMLVVVHGSNDAPSLSGTPAQLIAGTEDTPYVVTQQELLAGWSDPESGLIAMDLAATGATVTANEDGSFTITPDANLNGALGLTYVVTDGLASIAAGLELHIAAVNDAATGFEGQQSGTMTEDAAQSTVSGDIDCTDVDDASDTWLIVSAPQASNRGFGTFTVSASGAWQYQLNNAHAAVEALQTGESLVDAFTVATSDGTTTEISVTILGHTDVTYVYVTPPVSTAADANDFDSLHADLTRSSTLFNFYGTGSNEVLEGSNGNDVMRGQGGADVIYGHGGNDRLMGELDTSNNPPADGIPGNDTLYGQAGNDFLAGGLGSDILYGGSGADELYGNNSLGTNPETSVNTLYGGSGNDRLRGDAGNDVLVGGTGADWLTGGAGSDRFVFTSAADTGDWVFDFQRGADQLDLTAFGLDDSNFIGALSSPGMVGPGQVGFMTVMGATQIETFVYVDTDGVFGADLEIRLIGTSGLDGADILWP
jgi:VCBS repeat-containing protein